MLKKIQPFAQLTGYSMKFHLLHPGTYLIYNKVRNKFTRNGSLNKLKNAVCVFTIIYFYRFLDFNGSFSKTSYFTFHAKLFCLEPVKRNTTTTAYLFTRP